MNRRAQQVAIGLVFTLVSTQGHAQDVAEAPWITSDLRAALVAELRGANRVRVSTVTGGLAIVEGPMIVRDTLRGSIGREVMAGRAYRRELSFPLPYVLELEIESRKRSVLNGLGLGALLGLTGGLLFSQLVVQDYEAAGEPVPYGQLVGAISGFTVGFAVMGAAAGASKKEWVSVYRRP